MIAMLVEHAVTYLAAAPNPTPTAPPGADKFLTVLDWGAWVVFAVCIGGMFGVAGKMALNHNRGEGSQHMASLGYVLFACIIVSAASGVVGVLA